MQNANITGVISLKTIANNCFGIYPDGRVERHADYGGSALKNEPQAPDIGNTLDLA